MTTNYVNVVHCHECKKCKTIVNASGEKHFFCTVSFELEEVDLKHYCGYGTRNDN